MAVTQAGGAAPLRVGLFGGAFDPPHRAHRGLLEAAQAQLALDVLHVVPTGQAWHKARDLSPAHHRLAMVQLAFGDLPAVRVDDCELRRSGPSYTIDTLHLLQERYHGALLHLLIGADQALDFGRWRRVPEILQNAIICIADRAHPYEAGALIDSSSEIFTGARVRHLVLPALDVSATEIRSRVAARLGIDHLVAAPVARYIDQHHLYRTC